MVIADRQVGCQLDDFVKRGAAPVFLEVEMDADEIVPDPFDDLLARDRAVIQQDRIACGTDGLRLDAAEQACDDRESDQGLDHAVRTVPEEAGNENGLAG